MPRSLLVVYKLIDLVGAAAEACLLLAHLVFFSLFSRAGDLAHSCFWLFMPYR